MTTADPPFESAPSGDPSFPIEWGSGDEALEWEWDDMHTPRALPPLSQDYLQSLAQGFAYMYRVMDVPKGLLCRIFNGYTYFGLRIDAPAEEHAALRTRQEERCRAEIGRTADYWRDALTELARVYADMDALTGLEPAPELAAGWERAWGHAERAWQIHFRAILGPYQILDDLADFYERLFPGSPPADPLELVAGTEPVMRRVELELEELTAAAIAVPAIAARLRDAPTPTVEELEGVPGGEAFVAALEGFLARHGHLGQVTDDLLEPSWLEDPRPLLRDLGNRIGRDTMSSADRATDRAAVAERRAEIVRTALADRTEELEAFERLLATAREIGHLTEGHNYWIDRMANDRLRRLSRRVGRRLVADGVIDDPEDVVYLFRRELTELIGRPEDRRAVVEERRAIHAWQQTLTPPRKVGNVSAPDPDAKVDRFEGAHLEAPTADVVQGTGASAGVARGTARVVRGPDDFGRVNPGDIVVATTSNPGWVPLFAIAGGFVTDTGGVLSHAAVVAREFGVPAVVGTREGTKRIVDGRQIEIDGTTGVVRLA